jgi:hypothetical protein
MVKSDDIMPARNVNREGGFMKSSLRNKVLMFVLVWCSLIAMGPMCGGGQTFEILGTTPDADAINVLLDQPVEVTFNQSLDHDTITNDNFYVRDANGNNVEGTVAGTIPAPDITVSMAFTPTNPWAEGAVYTATVTTGLNGIVGRDQERVSLPENYSWSFTVRKWFEVGDAVSSEEAAAENPVMMVVGGSPAVGYLYNSSQENLHLWNGTAWDPAETDPTGGKAQSSYGAPGYCTDGTDVYLAYSAVSDGTYDYDRVLAYRWDSTNKWQAMNNGDELSLNNQYSATQATMACGSSFAAWVEGSNPTQTDDAYVADVTMTTSARSGPLSRNNTAGDYNTDVEIVSVVADGTDAYLATWENHETDQSRTDLYVTKWDGAAFTNLGDVIGSDHASSTLSAASMVKEGANLYLAYAAAPDEEGIKQLYVKRFDGTSWTSMGDAIAAYEGEEHIDSSNPSLIMAGDTLYVAWDEGSNSYGDGIFAAYWDAAAETWVIDNQNRVINQNVGGNVADPSLAYSAADEILYITFLVNKTGYDQVYVMKRNK